MRTQILYVLLTLIPVITSSQGVVYAQIDFSHFVTFGDSLTHNDILGLVYGNPQPLYAADPFEAVFNKGAIGTDELTSFAVGGSESVHVRLQVQTYRLLRSRGLQSQATLIGFEVGGNDVLNNVGLLSAHAPGQNEEADEVIDSLIANIRRALRQLSKTDPNADFLIWTVPDVTLTPGLINDLSEDEAMNVTAHIECANDVIRQFDDFEHVIVVDLFSFLKQFVENTPVICGQALVGPPAFGEFDHLFADDIHPTAVSNAFIADFMIFLINGKWNAGIPSFTEEELCELAQITTAAIDEFEAGIPEFHSHR